MKEGSIELSNEKLEFYKKVYEQRLAIINTYGTQLNAILTYSGIIFAILGISSYFDYESTKVYFFHSFLLLTISTAIAILGHSVIHFNFKELKPPSPAKNKKEYIENRTVEYLEGIRGLQKKQFILLVICSVAVFLTITALSIALIEYNEFLKNLSK